MKLRGRLEVGLRDRFSTGYTKAKIQTQSFGKLPSLHAKEIATPPSHRRGKEQDEGGASCVGSTFLKHTHRQSGAGDTRYRETDFPDTQPMAGRP